MGHRIEIGNLKIDADLYALVRDEIAPGTGIETDAFWKAFGDIVTAFAPENKTLLEKTRYAPATDRRVAPGAQR